MFAAALRSRVCQYNVDHPLDTCGCAGNYNTATVSTEKWPTTDSHWLGAPWRDSTHHGAANQYIITKQLQMRTGHLCLGGNGVAALGEVGLAGLGALALDGAL